MNSDILRAMEYGTPTNALEDAARKSGNVIWVCFTKDATGITIGERQWAGKRLPEAYEAMKTSIKEQSK